MYTFQGVNSLPQVRYIGMAINVFPSGPANPGLNVYLLAEALKPAFGEYTSRKNLWGGACVVFHSRPTYIIWDKKPKDDRWWGCESYNCILLEAAPGSNAQETAEALKQFFEVNGLKTTVEAQRDDSWVIKIPLLLVSGEIKILPSLTESAE